MFDFGTFSTRVSSEKQQHARLYMTKYCDVCIALLTMVGMNSEYNLFCLTLQTTMKTGNKR